VRKGSIRKERAKKLRGKFSLTLIRKQKPIELFDFQKSLVQKREVAWMANSEDNDNDEMLRVVSSCSADECAAGLQ
jgi:hypothetical protein